MANMKKENKIAILLIASILVTAIVIYSSSYRLATQPTGYFWVSVKVLTPWGYSHPHYVGDPITFEFQVTNKGSNTINHWEMKVELYNDETGDRIKTYRQEKYETIETYETITISCGTYTPQTDTDLYFNWEFSAWRPDGVKEGCSSGSHYWLRILPESSNRLPVASFTYTPTNPKVNEQVNLDASSSYDPDGSITRYYWDTNGDGTYDVSGSSPSVTTYYLKAGTYTVTLKVKDNEGATATTSKTITVEKEEEQNQAPVARFTYSPQNPQVGDTVYFDASNSYDPDGSITDYYWDWDGDGSFEGYGKTATHTFNEPGTYGVTLLVYDNDHEGNWTRQYITVEEGEQLPAIWVLAATTITSFVLLSLILRRITT